MWCHTWEAKAGESLQFKARRFYILSSRTASVCTEILSQREKREVRDFYKLKRDRDKSNNKERSKDYWSGRIQN